MRLEEFKNQLDGEVLGVTIVGSHMWRMNTPESDEDYHIIYQGDIEKILTNPPKGYTGGKHHVGKEDKRDFAAYEVGHVVQQLLQGNVNHLWGVLSPIIVESTPAFIELRRITQENLARNCFNSINGLAIHNVQLWFKRVQEQERTPAFLAKKAKIIARNIMFGIAILERGEVCFDVPPITSPEEIEPLLGRLKDAAAKSQLPDIPNKGVFHNYLLEIRQAAFWKKFGRDQ